MKFGATLVLIVAAVIFLVSAEAPERDVLDNAEESRKDCADAYKSCDTMKCCEGRTCLCSRFDNLCKCAVSTPGIVGSWFDD
uniref:U29-Sparatoxin-Hju1c_1 n=1 Tax=Heteropoda jugulans TaxID=1358901 RepID=A0A4Q8K470_9ARAC